MSVETVKGLKEEALEELIRRGKRVYFTDEKNIEDLAMLMRGFGLNKEAVHRFIDVAAFPDGTISEIVGFQGDQIVESKLFIKGQFTGKTVYLKDWGKLPKKEKAT